MFGDLVSGGLLRLKPRMDDLGRRVVLETSVAAGIGIAPGVARDRDVDSDDAGLAEERRGRLPGPSAFGGSGRIPLPSTPGCASSAVIDRATLTLAKLHRGPGAHRFELSGRLPLSPDLDPAGKGLSLRISDARGVTLLETRIPAGAQWKRNRRVFHYRDARGSQAIRRATVRAVRTKHGEFAAIKLVGKSAALGSTVPALPIVAEVSLDPDAPASLQCGETAFGAGPARPRCDRAKHGGRILCR
jgi:hypothetical protein